MILVFIGKPQHLKNQFYFHLQVQEIFSSSYSVGYLGRVNLVL